MKNFLQRFVQNMNKDLIIIVLVGASFLGFIKYVDYRFNLIDEQFRIINKENIEKSNFLNQQLAHLQDNISGTKGSLTDVLQQDSLLNNQFSQINNTVGALEKLSKTDPELLKKYSKIYFLNEHYVPVSLSDIGLAYRSTKSVNFQIHSNVLPYLEKMIDAGNASNVSIKVLSGFRSFAAQSDLKASYRFTYGTGANKFSADQGYSEHQLGTTVDFTTQKTDGELGGFEKTPEYQWLLDNAYKYGFVISYPEGNQYYKFEPWHWRFVGVALATRLHTDNIHFYDLDQRIIDSYLGNIFD